LKKKKRKKRKEKSLLVESVKFDKKKKKIERREMINSPKKKERGGIWGWFGHPIFKRFSFRELNHFLLPYLNALHISFNIFLIISLYYLN